LKNFTLSPRTQRELLRNAIFGQPWQTKWSGFPRGIESI